MSLLLRRIEPADWELSRALRLEALADYPLGYLETLEAARALDAAVYLAPAARGTGLLARLVDACAGWVREQGLAALDLEVHEDNPRARTAYERLGFVATGETTPYPLPPGGLERRMRLPLSPG